MHWRFSPSPSYTLTTILTAWIVSLQSWNCQALSTIALRRPTRDLSDYLPPLPASNQRLYLCRHGETDWTAQGRIQGGGYDIPLNNKGRTQAQLLAAALHHVNLDVVASSHLDRAEETADMIYNSQRHRRRAKRIISSKLGDMCLGSDWEGVTWKERETAFTKIKCMIQKNRHLEWPNGGESINEVAKRAEHAVLHHVMENKNQHICCVGHGRVNRILLEHLLKTDDLPKQVNAGINVLDRCPDGKWTLRVYNYHDHLADDE